MAQIIQIILGIILFFAPGVLLSYIISPKTELIKRTTYSIILAASISTILGFLLYLLGLFTAINTILVLISLILLFLLIILKSDKKHKTDFNKDFWYVIFFSIIGTLWRIWFLKSIKNFGDSYSYAGGFVGKTIPNLGFYTNMAVDHSRFIGNQIFYKISEFLLIRNIPESFGIFLITFLFLGFIYLIFFSYRNKKLAFIGVALMALGPIEIFHSTLNFFGHPFSYLALFSLFLLYKSEKKGEFYIALLLSITTALTYFTSSMVNALASFGFILALIIKGSFKNQKFNKKKLLCFIILILISLSPIFISVPSKEVISAESGKNVELITEHITNYPIMPYRDPTFLGLSAIRWQMLFFFLCGLTFIYHLIRKKDFSKNTDLILCLIPILIVSYGFFHTNLPTRIFDYFAFFGLLVLKIPKKYLKIFFILSFIFILVTGFYVAQDKKIFFETSNKEIKGAKWIASSLKGGVFSDQHFINQLILNNYYNVTGANDQDPIVQKLFYQNNPLVFKNAIDYLDDNLNVNYIILTKRMQEKYILMLDFPQQALTNSELYEKNLEKIYDNGDVKIYQIK